MIYNNRHYPHPVLGIGDDVRGEVQVKLKVSSDSEFIVLENTFSVNNKDLLKLIREKKASYSIHLTCTGTFFRINYTSEKELSDPIRIKSSDLNGEVELDYFICANENVDHYQNKESNDDYGDTKFNLVKGDILAYLGKGKFYANKTFQETTSISSLMNINTDRKSNHSFHLDYGEDKITIYLCQEDYELYQEIKLKKFASILHSSLVLPALVQVIGFMKTQESKEYAHTGWYKILEELLESKNDSDSLTVAQDILELPLKRTFSSMRELQMIY